MEASTTKEKQFPQPIPMSELLPGLKGILSKDAIRTLTAKKQPRATISKSGTAEKVMKPLTFAEMKADILALKPHSPRRFTQVPSNKKKAWNSSVKPDKKISHTANGQLKNDSVRKVLNFQTKAKTAPNLRMTTYNTETPKFPKPEFRAKKSLHLQTKNNIRISGICNIPQTPVETNKPVVRKFTITNKENNPYKPYTNLKYLPPPTPTNIKTTIAPSVIDTTLSNASFKSGSDASFLEREKEIHYIEEKVRAISEELTLENIAEVSPPVSTPFKEYRSVQEYFQNSNVTENSVACNDTIMCFDKPSELIDNDKREESVIVSLCDLFNKATVTNREQENISTELHNLLEVQKQTEQNIKMIESGIQILTNIKESQLKSLANVKNLIEEKKGVRTSESDNDKTLIAISKTPKFVEIKVKSPEKSPIISRPCSVIKMSPKSPVYKIPKKNLCLRKKIICKSMPNVSSSVQTPEKDIEGRALNMYMKMKEQMNFLSTPMVNRTMQTPDTPAMTSHNLQKQLDKLYNGS